MEKQFIERLLDKKRELVEELRQTYTEAESRSDGETAEDKAKIEKLEYELERVSDSIDHGLTQFETNKKDGEQRKKFEKMLTGTNAPQENPNPLAVSPDTLEKLEEAIKERRHLDMPYMDLERRAALTTGTLGSQRIWGSNVLRGPRIAHRVAGAPEQVVDGAKASHPRFTLPAATAPAAEGASLAEFATSTGQEVSLARYGRFTDFTAESQLGTSAEAVLAQHQIGIAKDLDLDLINQIEALLTPEAFEADVPAAIRKRMASVMDATAEDNPEALVVLAHPDDTHLLEDVAPVGGDTIGERFQRFSGALVYPSSAVDTGFMTVANLRAGVRFFRAGSPRVVNDDDAKTGTRTISSFLIAGYGINLTDGFAEQQDVVTP